MYTEIADKNCWPHWNKACTWCNCDQTYNKTCWATNECWLACLNNINKHPRNQSCCRRNCWCHKCVNCCAVCCKCATCIKAKPTEPKQCRTEKYKWNIVWLICTSLIISSLAKNNCKNKTCNTWADMYNITTGKVYGIEVKTCTEKSSVSSCSEETATPYHMCERIVNNDWPEADKWNKCLELHSARNSTSYKSRCDDRKHHLETCEKCVRNFKSSCAFWNAYIIKTEEVEASDNSTNITSERKRVTKQNPHNYCRTCNKHSCKHCVKDIFSSYKTSIEKCECWGHQENQCGTYDYKADTSAVHKTSLLKINFRK